MSSIRVQDLTKVYQVPVREAGVKAALRSLIYRETRDVVAVRPINFDIAEGEIVGFLGPNGAGKTTTIKMLAGLLHPTDGVAEVLGFTPSQRHYDYLRQITLVMGNRNQLMWDIPVIDSLERNRVIYNIGKSRFTETLGVLTDLLDLTELIQKPVRNLSLGERMKCEVAVALLHEPRVLFLDEPTIGLDVTMQRKLRAFIRDYNERTGASVLLTSHYMADVEALCKRVIVIHHGAELFDGDLSELVDRFTAYKTVSVKLGSPGEGLERFGEVISASSEGAVLRIPKVQAPQVTAELLQRYEVSDLTVEDPSIEAVIDAVFSSQQEDEAGSDQNDGGPD